jgi:glycosyltransferase involved in cell wall biosynthesis
VFYFIGEYIPRKNVEALIKAFHREFHSIEPVGILIKTSLGGLSSEAMDQRLSKDFNKIKSTMRLYHSAQGYTSENIITKRLTYAEMSQLHRLGNCFVMPSRGESLCRPLLDALYMGNQAIVTDKTGMVEAIDDSFAQAVKSYEAPVFSDSFPLPFLYTGRETWREIDVIALQRAMRKAYNNGKVVEDRCEKILERFSYTAVAEKIKEII